MKTTNIRSLLFTGFSLLALAPALHAEEAGPAATEHEHEERQAGPNGGRILTEVEPHTELFVTEDRKLQFTFLGEDGKKVAPAKQSVTVICGQRSNPTRMTFAEKDGVLLSDKELPEGKNIPAVIQIKESAEAQTKTIRLNLNLADCPGCEHLEYACTCDHDHDGHDH